MITPIPKPRMVRSDKWKKRDVVNRYWAFKDELVSKCNRVGINSDTIGDILGVEFVIPMPKSWSKKKKENHNNQKHQQKPDLDNLIKAVKDCLMVEDSHIWKYDPPPKKTWGKEGKIIIYAK